MDIYIIIPNYIFEDNIYRWHKGILNILIENKKLIKIDTITNTSDIIEIYPKSPMIIDIKYIEYLRSLVFEYYKIPFNINLPSFKVLYTRIQDTSRRHVLNYEIVKDNFDLIIHSLNISFEEQVKLFSKITHFVSVELGAHSVNIMFMQPNSRVMNILTRTNFTDIDKRPENYDSWQMRFGTYKLIKEFNINTKASQRIRCSDGAACGDHDMHDHIYIDDELKFNILNFLK